MLLDFDVTDSVDLMEKAHAALTKWFDLIAPMDIQQAVEVVGMEK